MLIEKLVKKFKRDDQDYFLEESNNVLEKSEIQGRDWYNNLGKMIWAEASKQK